MRITKSAVLILMSISTLAMLSFSCKDVGVQPPDKTITLTVEDASCTEVWLKLSVANLSQPTITLKRDGITLDTIYFAGADTTIIDENLLPSHSYTYTASLLNGSLASSLTARTMDTTNHNFVWDPQVLLGDGSSSVLYDVTIINDTLAYGVGEIYLKDSLGNWDPNAYNLVKWDGRQWLLKRIPFIGSCSAVDYPPIKSIWAFSNNNILFTNGGSIVTYNGTNAVMDCRMNSLLIGAINKIYAVNPQDVYAVGNSGTIVHYNNGNWVKIESGTTLDVYDIFGAKNDKTGEIEIYAVAAKQFVSFDKAILRIIGNNVTPVSIDSIPYSIHGVWFKPGQQYYVVGSGIYSKQSILTDRPWQWVHPGITNYYIAGISGNDVNDIMVCGSYGELLHFNGTSWKSYISQTFMSGAYTRVSLKGNLCIAVGSKIPLAVVVIGKR